jgi:uncharacterized protein DUF433
MRAMDIVVQDEEILGGTPVFRGTRVAFQALLDYLEGGRRLTSFWTIFRPFPKRPRLRRWNLRDRSWSINLG